MGRQSRWWWAAGMILLALGGVWIAWALTIWTALGTDAPVVWRMWEPALFWGLYAVYWFCYWRARRAGKGA